MLLSLHDESSDYPEIYYSNLTEGKTNGQTATNRGEQLLPNLALS